MAMPLRRGSVLSNITLLAGGTAVGQIMTVLTAPLLTRLYAPDDMGRLGVYMAFVSVASVTTALRYDYGIVTAQTSSEAAHLTVIALALLFPTSLVLAGGLYLAIERGALGFGVLPPIASALVLLSLVATGASTALRYWFVRHEEFGLISGVLVRQSGVRSIGQIGVGVAGMGWAGLLAGDVLGRAYGVSRMARIAWSSIGREVQPLDWSIVCHVLKAYRKFPLYDMPSAVVDALAVSMMVPLIAQLYGTQSAGYFALVSSVQSIPIAFVGGSVADVFHARMAHYIRYQPTRVRPFFMATSGALLLVGVVPASIVVLFGPSLFGWLFGERWQPAGQLAAAMAPWALSALVVSPVSRVIALFQAQEFKFVYDGLALIGVAAAVGVAATRRLDLVESVRLLSLSQVCGYVVYFGLLVRVLQRAERG